MCFRADQKNKMAIPASDLLRHFRLLLWNRRMEFNKTSSTKFVFFGSIGKTRWPPWLLIGWDIFDFLWNRWIEFNETWQEARFQRPLPSLSFSDWPENKIDAPPSDWLPHFRLLVWNRWTEFNKTWQEARCQRPLQSLCFFWGRSEKTKWPPWPIRQKGGTLYSCARYGTLWASCLPFLQAPRAPQSRHPTYFYYLIENKRHSSLPFPYPTECHKTWTKRCFYVYICVYFPQTITLSLCLSVRLFICSDYI